jgi:threonine dehydrogenase-like Zn-dependent dehydrogenase
VTPDALDRARSFGATHAVFVNQLDEFVAEMTQGRGVDIALELAGTASSVELGIRLARTGGTVVLAGTVAPTPTVPIDPECVVRRMLTIRGVHNYAPCDLEKALAFLAGPGRLLPFAGLIGQSFPLEQAEQAFSQAHAHPGLRVAVLP